MTTKKHGHPHGLMLIANTEAERFYSDVPVTSVGINFFLHPYGVPHFLIKDTVSVLAKPGAWTQVEIEETEVHRLRSPYEPHCDEVDYKIIRGYPYSKATCEIDIILQKIYEKCACVGWEWQGFVAEDIPICRIEDMRCYYATREKGLLENSEVSSSQCPIECVTTKYSVVTSELSFGNDGLYQRILDAKIPGYNKSYKQTKDYVKTNIVGARIGFRSLTKRVEKYNPAVSWDALIGTIGGSLGLCFGFSLITGLEFMFFIFDYISVPGYERLKMRKTMKIAPTTRSSRM